LYAEEKVSEKEVMNQYILKDAFLARAQTQDKVGRLLYYSVKSSIALQLLFQDKLIGHLGQKKIF
jgi:hypothetical protein